MTITTQTAAPPQDNLAGIVGAYIAMWNEGDAARRQAITTRILTPDVVYLDPLMASAGPEGVSAMIGEAQKQFAGLTFTRRGEAQATGDHIRFAWSLGPEGGPSVAAGTDFARLDDGRLSCVTGFIDQAPGEPPPA